MRRISSLLIGVLHDDFDSCSKFLVEPRELLQAIIIFDSLILLVTHENAVTVHLLLFTYILKNVSGRCIQTGSQTKLRCVKLKPQYLMLDFTRGYLISI